MSKKSCKGNGPKYVIAIEGYIDGEPMSKGETEDEITEMLNDYAEEDILLFRLEKVDFEIMQKDVVVEIID